VAVPVRRHHHALRGPNLTDESIVKDKDGKPVIDAFGEPRLDA